MKKFLAIVCALTLALSCLFVLTSCFGATPNSDPEAAKASLEDAGYTVYMAGNTLTAMSDGDTITIQYCDTEEEAQAIYDGYVEAEELAKELADELGEDYDDGGYEYGCSGTMVWVGTSAAISAAK